MCALRSFVAAINRDLCDLCSYDLEMLTWEWVYNGAKFLGNLSAKRTKIQVTVSAHSQVHLSG